MHIQRSKTYNMKYFYNEVIYIKSIYLRKSFRDDVFSI